MEPWLGPRVCHEAITIRPNTCVVGTEPKGAALQIRLNTGETVEVDHVLYATGYKVDLSRVPLLKSGNFLDRIECRGGFPVLDEFMQTSVPGLFMTSLAAARDFGLFFAFTAAARASAHLIGRALARRFR